MKMHPFFSVVLRLLWVAGFLSAAFPATAEETGKNVPLNADGTPQIPAEILMGEVKATSFSDRAALQTKLKDAEVRFDTRLPEWEARKNGLPEKERTTAAADLKELKRMREVLRQKIDAVDFADAATWNSVKYELYAAMMDTISVYKKLRYRLDD
jgi:hypothetical protein